MIPSLCTPPGRRFRLRGRTRRVHTHDTHDTHDDHKAFFTSNTDQQAVQVESIERSI
jgi:hypothetical protein